jgi:hypothetical protein
MKHSNKNIEFKAEEPINLTLSSSDFFLEYKEILSIHETPSPALLETFGTFVSRMPVKIINIAAIKIIQKLNDIIKYDRETSFMNPLMNKNIITDESDKAARYYHRKISSLNALKILHSFIKHAPKEHMSEKIITYALDKAATYAVKAVTYDKKPLMPLETLCEFLSLIPDKIIKDSNQKTILTLCRACTIGWKKSEQYRQHETNIHAFVCKWLNYYDEGPDDLGHHPVDSFKIPLELNKSKGLEKIIQNHIFLKNTTFTEEGSSRYQKAIKSIAGAGMHDMFKAHLPANPEEFDRLFKLISTWEKNKVLAPEWVKIKALRKVVEEKAKEPKTTAAKAVRLPTVRPTAWYVRLGSRLAARWNAFFKRRPSKRSNHDSAHPSQTTHSSKLPSSPNRANSKNHDVNNETAPPHNNSP